MKVTTNEQGVIQLEEVFNGIILKLLQLINT